MQGPDHAALSGCSSGFYPGVSDHADVPVLQLILLGATLKLPLWALLCVGSLIMIQVEETMQVREGSSGEGWPVLTHLDKTSPPRSCHPLEDSVVSFMGHPVLPRVSCSSLLCHKQLHKFHKSLAKFPFVLRNKLDVTAKPHLGDKPAWCD